MRLPRTACTSCPTKPGAPVPVLDKTRGQRRHLSFHPRPPTAAKGGQKAVIVLHVRRPAPMAAHCGRVEFAFSLGSQPTGEGSSHSSSAERNSPFESHQLSVGAWRPFDCLTPRGEPGPFSWRLRHRRSAPEAWPAFVEFRSERRQELTGGVSHRVWHWRNDRSGVYHSMTAAPYIAP